jgi:hypothetical protein
LIATTVAVGEELVGWAVARRPWAYFLQVARAGAGSTYSSVLRKLAVRTARLVGVVADSIVFEFASGGIAARIVSTSCCSTTIALFTALHNSIPALTARDGDNGFVIHETTGFDTIATEGRTNVSDSALGERFQIRTR